MGTTFRFLDLNRSVFSEAILFESGRYGPARQSRTISSEGGVTGFFTLSHIRNSPSDDVASHAALPIIAYS